MGAGWLATRRHSCSSLSFDELWYSAFTFCTVIPGLVAEILVMPALALDDVLVLRISSEALVILRISLEALVSSFSVHVRLFTVTSSSSVKLSNCKSSSIRPASGYWSASSSAAANFFGRMFLRVFLALSSNAEDVGAP